ncbi:MAG: hypothetical protein ACXWK5_02975 [Myxococcaceae bacterium]
MRGGQTTIVFEPTLDSMGTAYEHKVARELLELVARAKEAGAPGRAAARSS